MTTQPDYLRYLESAKQAELAEQLRRNGFQVQTNEALDDVHFDLVARKDNKTVVYEFKSEGNSRLDRAKLNRLQEVAKTAGYEFRIVVVFPPARVNVEIDDLASQLTDYLINNFPSELDSLSSHTIIDGVSDISVKDVRIRKTGILIEGTGGVEVTLQYGSGADGVSTSDSFPFRFTAHLNPDSSLASVEELEIDTSSFED